jgi:hypothetical protein
LSPDSRFTRAGEADQGDLQQVFTHLNLRLASFG